MNNKTSWLKLLCNSCTSLTITCLGGRPVTCDCEDDSPHGSRRRCKARQLLTIWNRAKRRQNFSVEPRDHKLPNQTLNKDAFLSEASQAKRGTGPFPSVTILHHNDLGESLASPSIQPVHFQHRSPHWLAPFIHCCSWKSQIGSGIVTSVPKRIERQSLG